MIPSGRTLFTLLFGLAAISAADTLTGPQKIMVLRVRFHDYADNSRFTRADIQGLFDKEINTLWTNLSYGNISISATVPASLRFPGSGLYQLPDNRSSYVTDHNTGDTSDNGQYMKVLNDSVDLAVTDKVDFSGVTAVVVIMAEADPSQFHRGQGNKCNLAIGPGGSKPLVGCAIFSENPGTPTEPPGTGTEGIWGRWSHELGHAFQQGGPAHPSNYNSNFELMDALYPGQSGMFEKQQGSGFPGWMPPAKYKQLCAPGMSNSVLQQLGCESTGGGTVVLGPEENPPETGIAFQAIKVAFSPDLYYMVSVRQKANGDELYPIPDEGVLIERVVNGGDKTINDALKDDGTIDKDHPVYRWVTVQGAGPVQDRDKLYQENPPVPFFTPSYSNTNDGLTINVDKKISSTVGGFAGYQVTVTFGQGLHPDVMIRPWLSQPHETYETTDIWIDSSCNGYGTFQYGTLIPDGDSAPVGDGNGDNPCANHENRVYSRIRNIGNQTATGVKVYFEVTDPLGVGIVGPGSGNWTLISSVTSAEFPGLNSIPPGGTVDVFVPWTPVVPPDQLTTGNFNFHSCIRVRMDSLSGELNISNQDGNEEQENIAQFYSQPSGGGPGLPIDPVVPIRNDSSQPRSFNLSWDSSLPADWSLTVNGNNTVLDLAAGEVRQIPVHIVPNGARATGGIYRIKIAAESNQFLANDRNPADAHPDFEQLSAVTIEVRIATPSTIGVNTRPGGAGLIVNGQLLPAAHPGMPVMVELLDAQGHVLGTRLTLTDASGNYSTDLQRPGATAFAAASFAGEPFQQGAYARVAVALLSPPFLIKAFAASTISVGGTSSLKFTLRNPNAGAGLTAVGFIDTLPPGLTVANPNGLAGSCDGGIVTAASGSSSISLSAATLAPGAVCTFSVIVTGTTAGLKFNSTGSITSLEAGGGLPATSAIAVGVLPGPGTCGAGNFPDPLTLFGGWTFSTEGFGLSAQPFASAGRFVATRDVRNSVPAGLLAITSTASSNGQIIRQETDAGSYQIYSDCSGGTLTFNLSTRPLAFDFWFVEFGRIAFVSTTPGVTVRGSAVAGTTTCGQPENPDPLAQLGVWTFSTEGLVPNANAFASAGRFLTNARRLLSVTNSASLNGQIIRQESDAGSYQISSDCSGGTLTFNLSTRPLAFDFWFGNGGNELRLVSTTPDSTVHGIAKSGGQ